MTGEELLQHAAAVVRDRRQDLRRARAALRAGRQRWSQHSGTKVTATQVALCLCDLKLARLTVDPRHLDSLVDLAGYTAVAREVQR
jgi:hypothetical protein